MNLPAWRLMMDSATSVQKMRAIISVSHRLSKLFISFMFVFQLHENSDLSRGCRDLAHDYWPCSNHLAGGVQNVILHI